MRAAIVVGSQQCELPEHARSMAADSTLSVGQVLGLLELNRRGTGA